MFSSLLGLQHHLDAAIGLLLEHLVGLGRILEGKVVVDISNPLNETYTGLVTEGGPSGAERIRERVPSGARLVKAFNTTFAADFAEPVIAGDRVGRNDPCPCGSGKKYKHCHGAA